MSHLYIFNPSHDEALAANSAYYYPGHAARILGADLAVLPAWWAHEGDFVLLPQEVALPPEDFTRQGIRFVHLLDAQKWKEEISEIIPWGWDPLLVQQLRKAKFAESLLPSDEQLDRLRQLSCRATSVKILEALRHDLPETVGESFWCTDAESVEALIHRYHATMLKAPWSSSGRGVFVATEELPENIRQRYLKILKTQEAVEVEPLYDRIADFALEFTVTSSEISYNGLSVFATTSTGAYTGNKVATEEELLGQLPTFIQEMLPATINSLQRHLSALLVSRYEGPLGVDMMYVKDADGRPRLHPCVEINLRNTMGHVALHLRSWLPSDKTGIYSIRPVSETTPDMLRLTPSARQMEGILQLASRSEF